MAGINIAQHKKAQELIGKVDLTDYNGSVLEYKLSKSLMEKVKVINAKNEEMMLEKMKPLLKTQIKNPDIAKLSEELMKSNNLKEIMKMQKEIMAQYNVAEEFFYCLEGAPDREEFKEWYNENLGDMADVHYKQLMTEVFDEFTEMVKQSGLEITPR